MKPDVSVIIPTRKRPELLAETIKSVRAQEGVTTEIIVVDDCPDSSAAPIAAAFEGVVYCRNPTVSQGRPAKVRNFGLTMATGELVHFLDDDDIVPRGHYAAVKNAFADRPDVGVVFGAIEPFGTDAFDDLCSYFALAALRARRCALLGPRLGFSAVMFFRPILFVCGAAIIRRKCVYSLGGFDANLPLYEDVEFYARAILSYGAAVLPRVSIRYRIHHPSLMRQPETDALTAASYKGIHARLRADRGVVVYLGLKTLARLIKLESMCVFGMTSKEPLRRIYKMM